MPERVGPAAAAAAEKEGGWWSAIRWLDNDRHGLSSVTSCS